MTEPAPHLIRSSFRRRIVYGTGLLASILALMLASGFLFLQTGSGREWLRARLSSLLTSKPHQIVELGAISGILPWDIRLESLEVGDALGTWLSVEGLALRWSPGRLLLGVVRIQEIRAASIEVRRFPRSREDKPPGEPRLPTVSFKAPPLTIQILSFPRLAFGRDALGQAVEMEAAGFLAPSDPSKARTLALQVRRVDQGPSLETHLVGHFDEDAESLALDLDVMEAPDGLVAHLLGLKDAGDLDLRLAGRGPAPAWRGGMEARSSRRGSITAAFSLALAQEPSLELSGVVHPFPGRQADSGEGDASRDTVVQLKARRVEGKGAYLDRFDARGSGLTLTAEGQLDENSQAVQLGLSLWISDLRPLAADAGSEVTGRGELCIEVAGTTRDPLIDLSVSLQDIMTGAGGASSALQHLRMETVQPAPDGQARSWRLAGAGRASGLRDHAGHPLPEESLAWTVEAELSPGRDTVHLQTLRVDGAHHQLQARGSLSTSTLVGSLQADLRIQDTQALTRLLGHELPGSLHLALTMTGDGSTRSATGKLAGKLSPRAGPTHPLAGILGPETHLTSDFLVSEGKTVQVDQAVLASPAFEVKGSGSLDLAGGQARAELLADAPDIKPLSILLREDLSGAIQSGLKVEGPLDDLSISHWLEGRRVRWGQQPPSEIQSRLEASQVPGKARGQWTLRVNRAAEKLEASMGFELAGKRLRLNGVRVDGPGARLNGDLTLALEAWTAEGALQGRFDDLARMGRFLGRPLGGSASLDARLSAPRGIQSVTVKLGGSKLSSGAGRISSLAVDADFQDLFKIPRGKLQAELSGLEAGSTRVRTASLKVDGDRNRLAFTGRAGGRMRQEAEIQLAGDLSRSNGALKLELFDLKGHYGSYPFRLNHRVAIEHSSQGGGLDGLSLALGPGTLAAEGRITENRVQGRLSIDNLPLDLVTLAGGPDWSGKARGKLEIDGSPTQPSGSVDLHLAEFRMRSTEERNLRAAFIHGQARLEGGTFRGAVTLEQVLDEPARLDFALPLRLSLSPRLVWEVPPGGPLQASADLEGELGRLAGLLPFSDQTLSGHARASVSVSGTVAEPIFRGAMRLSDGFYENLNTGTVLKGIQGEVTARDRLLEISRFEATDGGRGRISLGGRMEIDGARHFPLEIEALLQDASLVHRSDLDATADGKVRLSGTLGAPRVEGDLTVAPAEYRIPDRLPPGAAELRVIEIDAHGLHKAPKEPDKPGLTPLPLDLNLALGFPNRAYVRGRGLDSEWRGRMTVVGTAGRPALTGRLDVVRGRFDFLDRRFELSQGAITFLGGIPPDPLLDFKAESRARDITAILKVTGAVSSPSIQLDSDPPLPPEEVLARLLFGRSVDRISPIQALRLAQAMRTLSGSSRLPGLDFVGATRRLLGLDQLELRNTAGGAETGLGLGKYLTEDIYVDVEKNLGGTGGRISVEVELTPNISIESEVGSDAQTGIGINWKHDY